MLRARIAATAAYQAGRPVTTRQLAENSAQRRTVEELERLTGIQTRHFAEPTETIASQAAVVVQRALDQAGIAACDVKRLILTNSTGFDMVCPATSNVVLDLLGMDGTAGCTDLNNACVGYLTALDYAARLVHTGVSPVVIVASELGSQHIRPDDPRPYLIFGDAAAAAVITAPEPGADVGVLASHFANRGGMREGIVMRRASLTGKRETLEFTLRANEIAKLAVLGLQTTAEAIFAETGLGWADIDWVVPHQPNGTMLMQITELFSIPLHKLVPVVHRTGNVGSASTAVGLAELFATRTVLPGQTVLLIGVGGGLSYGAVLYRVG